MKINSKVHVGIQIYSANTFFEALMGNLVNDKNKTYFSNKLTDTVNECAMMTGSGEQCVAWGEMVGIPFGPLG